MNVQVAFGKQGLSLELPDGPDYHVVNVHSAPPLPDVEKALGAALDSPVAGLPLIELAHGKKTRGHLGLRYHPARSQPNYAASPAGAAASRRHSTGERDDLHRHRAASWGDRG